ncbi:MAG: trans-aconitate 2-methyltransferase [Baekduiaceae bacterium]
MEETLSGPTLVQRAIRSTLLPVASAVPVPHRVALGLLLRDNALELQRDGWGRLWDIGEAPRYAVVRDFCERFGGDAHAILDVGCAQGILQCDLHYGTYTGIDLSDDAIARAQPRADAHTTFDVADAATYTPARPYDVIVFNECLYYLRDPVGVAQRYLEHLTPGGVIVISMFDRMWAMRRLLRRLHVLGPVAAHAQVANGDGARWTVRVHRPTTSPA